MMAAGPSGVTWSECRSSVEPRRGERFYRPMPDLPDKLHDLLELFSLVPDRADRIQLLIDTAERFQEVPPEVATRPFAEEYRVPACESEAFVWAEKRSGGTLKYHFAVENPQGISAKAMAVVLDETLSGESPETIARVPSDIVYSLFGRELSMGKSMGLMGMVNMVTTTAKKLGAGAIESD